MRIHVHAARDTIERLRKLRQAAEAGLLLVLKQLQLLLSAHLLLRLTAADQRRSDRRALARRAPDRKRAAIRRLNPPCDRPLLECTIDGIAVLAWRRSGAVGGGRVLHRAGDGDGGVGQSG